ncbi:ribosome assembly factor SBDS [Candidatus Woesearchaeota archaeon]|nr:ribosome assembly factor SBDS [Candidatus Woesearchaeota archaeon]|tara:strand:+ start:9164 stop:9883 length:720 start_codon:yes stop_codon:yes gene_type:complete
MKGSELFDKEKAHFNLARLTKGGEQFEIIVEPDKAISYKNGSISDVKETMKYEKVFSDAKKGLLASEESMKKVFETVDSVKIAEVVLSKGKIQLTSQYRDSLRDAKKKQLIELIHRNAVDPKTNLPHPVTRLENAFNEAKVHVDERKAEDQLEGVLKLLRPILPIRFETRKLQLLIPSKYASKAYSTLKGFGRIIKDTWHSDGTLLSVIEIPAGLQQELTEQLNKLTHGDVDIKISEEN